MPGVSSTTMNRKKMSPALKYRMKVLEQQMRQNQLELKNQAEQALEIVTVLQECYTELLQNKVLNEITAAKQAEYERVLRMLIAKVRAHHDTIRPILEKRIVTNGDVDAAAGVTLALRAETRVLQDYSARWHNDVVAPREIVHELVTVVNHSDQFMHDLANTMLQCAEAAAPELVQDIAPDEVQLTENLECPELLPHSASDSE